MRTPQYSTDDDHRHCGKNHCLGLPLPDGSVPVTPRGECRRCVRERQRRWLKTDLGQSARSRYESSAKGFLRNVRYNASIRGSR